MHVVAPNEVSTCRSKGPTGEWIERTYDYVIARERLRGTLSLMKVVEDFSSRPPKAVGKGAKRCQANSTENSRAKCQAMPGIAREIENEEEEEEEVWQKENQMEMQWAEDEKKEAYRGRGSSLEWSRVRRSKNIG